jgi:hypothetical protein
MIVMMYIFLDKDQLKLLYLKKSFVGQYEVKVFDKKHQTNLLENGKVVNVDFTASAIKEGLNAVLNNTSNGKEVILILPQESFSFFRTEVPADINPSAFSAFIHDKARTTLNIDIDNSVYDYFVEENGGQKLVSFYAIDNEVLAKYVEIFNLLELKISSVLPESLCYFKLFKKTLRKDKKEIILYSVYQKDRLKGYFYDSTGLLTGEPWHADITSKRTVESLIKQKADEYEEKGQKINRLILSGEESDNIRQDTFTKEVGIWTNPLKRIIPNFYEEYLKLLVTSSSAPFPILTYDVCFGAFIMFHENKNFAFLKNSIKHKNVGGPKVSLGKFPFKEILIFLVSFGLSFGAFIALSKSSGKLRLPKINAISFAQPTATPTPTPKPVEPTATPTPAMKKGDIKVKVLNGAGTAGKATQVKNLLEKKGYGEVLTGNADNFNYTSTEIQVKKSTKELADIMKEDIKANTTKVKVTTLEEDAAADIVLIFGSDFK